MNFYFCETCGKRITDAEIQRKEGFDKQAKGIYCKTCAVGVNTEQFEAIVIPKSSPQNESPPFSPPAAATRPISTAAAALNLKTTARKGAQRDLKSDARAPSDSSAMTLYIGLGALAIIALVVLGGVGVWNRW